MAFCTAVSINTGSGRENAPSDDVAAIMAALSLDMADWWEPTADTYLFHVGKDRIIGIVAETVSPEIAHTMKKLKKGELVEAAEAKLSGLRWLPANFRANSQT